MNQKEASAKIAELIKEAQAKMKEATEIADKAGVDFSFQGPTGDVYGMGGWYTPDPKKAEDWQDSGCEWEDSGCSGYEDNYGWQASSQSC